jgi:DNA-nicking Smr family endonuclease
MTQEPAHRALTRFIARAYDEGRRGLLIITGKGSADGTGVLRQAVPRWLAEPACRAMILAVEEAQPKDGGAGALYVLLRRRR